jgi:hypothetical protein
MKITERLLEGIAGGLIDRKVGEKVDKLKEALIIPQDGIDKDEHLWRLLTKNKNRNLDPLTQDRMIEIAVWLNTMNGFAHRILEMNKDFVIGDGIRYEAKDSTVREILDEHWYDSVNNWSLKQFNRVMELGLYGEQLYPVFVNEYNGFVRLGVIDPSQISKITVNPENAEEMKTIELKTSAENSDKPKTYKVIALDMDPKSEQYGYRTGEAFFFAVNKLSTATRGISDLLSIADWIDGYERFLFNRLDRSHLLNQFIWDILLEGYNPEQIKEWMKEFQMPKPGSVRAHNEKVKWDVVSPKLESADASEEAKMFKSHILGQAGFPPHYFAEGEGITRACYSEDTQTLTENGWKFHWEIEEREKIATYNPRKDSLEYHIPVKKYVYDYEGEMYHFKNLRTDILVSPEHKMYLRESHKKDFWIKVMAKDIFYHSFYFKESPLYFNGKNQEYFELPFKPYDIQSRKKDFKRIIPMINWLPFLGIFISEGYLRKSKNRYIVRIAQKKYVDEFRKLIACLGFEFREDNNGRGVTVFEIANKSLYLYLSEFIGENSHEKRIPKEFMNLSQDYLNILFHSMIMGDGTFHVGKGENYLTYYTSSEKLSGQMQELCLKLGYSSRCSESKKGKFSWKTISITPIRERNLRKNKDVFKEKYNGKIYCFDVPNHLFITRRNGKIGIHSNTAMEMGTPVFKRLKARQTYVKYMVTEIFAFVIDQAIIHGRLKPDVDRSFSLFFPKLAEKDFSGLSTAISNLSNALVVGEDQQWITKDWAKKAYLFILSQFGFDMQIEEGPVKNDMSESTYEFKEYLQAKVKEARMKLKKSCKQNSEEIEKKEE